MKESKLPFIDAQEMRINNIETFEAPNKEELDALKVGVHVKVCTGDERFWVKVTGIESDTVKGTVDNNLINIDEHGLDFGDTIVFNKTNIYDIIDTNAM
jgi:hypothetical protein